MKAGTRDFLDTKMSPALSNAGTDTPKKEGRGAFKDICLPYL